MPFQPVDNRRLYEQVAAQIGDLIGRGEFTPGQRLPAERDLAKQLGVSRPVVREAMIALEIAGLLEVRTGSGAYVCEKPVEPATPLNIGHSPTDILNARRLIEGEIAALAAMHAAAGDVDAMGGQIAQMQADHDAGRPWQSADLGFHAAIARASGNAALVSVVERLWQDQHAPVFTLLSERMRLSDNWNATLAGHQAIFAAIRARRPDAAREAMRAHLDQVLETMMDPAREAAAAS